MDAIMDTQFSDKLSVLGKLESNNSEFARMVRNAKNAVLAYLIQHYRQRIPTKQIMEYVKHDDGAILRALHHLHRADLIDYTPVAGFRYPGAA